MLALEITSFEILEELATSLVDADELCDHTDRGACIEISPSSHRDAKALNARTSRSLQSTCSVVKFGVVDAVSDVLNGDAVVTARNCVENARAGNVLNKLDLGITGVREIEMAHPIARLATVKCPRHRLPAGSHSTMPILPLLLFRSLGPRDSMTCCMKTKKAGFGRNISGEIIWPGFHPSSTPAMASLGIPPIETCSSGVKTFTTFVADSRFGMCVGDCLLRRKGHMALSPVVVDPADASAAPTSQPARPKAARNSARSTAVAL